MSTLRELTERCRICYCDRIDVDVERSRITCGSSECGCIYVMNEKETDGVRILLKIDLIDTRFELLDL